MSLTCPTGKHAGKWVTLVNKGATQKFAAVIQRFQCFSTIVKRDRFNYSKRSLFIARIMLSFDTCPKGPSMPLWSPASGGTILTGGRLKLADILLQPFRGASI